MASNAGHMTDAQARNTAIKALRRARVAIRRSTTLGESCDRELDRLIKRKTRINSSSLVSVANKYATYLMAVESAQGPLADSYSVVAQF